MAVNPNTDFTAGNVLTAAQQNRFPRGLMWSGSINSNDTVTTEKVIYTFTFTAAANRMYKYTWIEPDIGISGAGSGTALLRYRVTNISGSIIQQGYNWIPSSSVDTTGSLTAIVPSLSSSGSRTIVATAQATGGVTITLNRGAGKDSYMFVEDMGPY